MHMGTMADVPRMFRRMFTKYDGECSVNDGKRSLHLNSILLSSTIIIMHLHCFILLQLIARC